MSEFSAAQNPVVKAVRNLVFDVAMRDRDIAKAELDLLVLQYGSQAVAAAIEAVFCEFEQREDRP